MKPPIGFVLTSAIRGWGIDTLRERLSYELFEASEAPALARGVGAGRRLGVRAPGHRGNGTEAVVAGPPRRRNPRSPARGSIPTRRRPDQERRGFSMKLAGSRSHGRSPRRCWTRVRA